MTKSIPQFMNLPASQTLKAYYSKVKEPFGALIHVQSGIKLRKALAMRIIPEIEVGAKGQLKHVSSSNNFIRFYESSKNLLKRP